LADLFDKSTGKFDSFNSLYSYLVRKDVDDVRFDGNIEILSLNFVKEKNNLRPKNLQ